LIFFGSVIDDTRLGLSNRSFLISGEENKIVDILEKSLLICIKGFLRSVFASVINRDSYGSSEVNAQSSSFNLLESESSSISNSVIIPNSCASNNRSKAIERSWSNGSSSYSSGLKSSAFPSCLIEPNSHICLPMFSEMDIRDDVVVLNHLSQKILIIKLRNNFGKDVKVQKYLKHIFLDVKHQFFYLSSSLAFRWFLIFRLIRKNDIFWIGLVWVSCDDVNLFKKQIQH